MCQQCKLSRFCQKAPSWHAFLFCSFLLLLSLVLIFKVSYPSESGRLQLAINRKFQPWSVGVGYGYCWEQVRRSRVCLPALWEYPKVSNWFGLHRCSPLDTKQNKNKKNKTTQELQKAPVIILTPFSLRMIKFFSLWHKLAFSPKLHILHAYFLTEYGFCHLNLHTLFSFIVVVEMCSVLTPGVSCLISCFMSAFDFVSDQSFKQKTFHPLGWFPSAVLLCCRLILGIILITGKSLWTFDKMMKCNQLLSSEMFYIPYVWSKM